MISMVTPGNDDTTGVCWGKLKINRYNSYQPYHNHKAGKNTVMAKENYQGGLMK